MHVFRNKIRVGATACKISGKIEFSHHGFVMAFSYAESEERPRQGGAESLISHADSIF